MKPKRILLVGEAGRSKLYRHYYNVDSKLANGFNRMGHHVIFFSERDHAREAGFLRHKAFGRKKMVKKLIEVAQHYQPHVILFGHTDLLPISVFDILREQVQDVKLAAFCVDASFRVNTMQQFRERVHKVDAAFITTGDQPKLRSLGFAYNNLYFMPNPVDSSIETGRVFEIDKSNLDHDAQFLGTGINKREEQIKYIEDNLPTDFRFSHGGRMFNTERLRSIAFYHQLAKAPVSPNLPLDDTKLDQVDYLYSSDRLAQLLGMGVTTLTHSKSQLSDLYDDGVIEYDDRDDLIEKMLALWKDDSWRKEVGNKGHKISHSRTNITRIAHYLLAITCEEKPPEVFWNLNAT